MPEASPDAMNWLEKFVWYFQSGGILMYPLAAISILALAVIVERAIRLRRIYLFDLVLVEKAQSLLEAAKFKEALALCTGATVLVGKVIEAALKEFIHTEADIETSLKECGQRELQVLQNNLSVLGTIARIAPLMGLLGTVLGMIGAFEVLSETGVGKEEMAKQIRIALITTATGLIIAIPTVIAAAYFRARIRKIVALFEEIFIDAIKSVKIGVAQGGQAALDAASQGDETPAEAPAESGDSKPTEEKS